MKRVKGFNEEGIEYEELVNTNDYQRFIDVAFKYADSIVLTYNKSKEKFDKSIWSFLNSSIIDMEETKETAVTIGPKVLLLYFKLDKTTKDWLRNKDNIYDFPQNGKEWLDDLCFIKNGEIVFASCTHERFNFMNQELSNLFLKYHQA